MSPVSTFSLLSPLGDCRSYIWKNPHNPLPRNALLHVWMRYRHWMKFTPWFCERKCLKLLMTIFFHYLAIISPFRGDRPFIQIKVWKIQSYRQTQDNRWSKKCSDELKDEYYRHDIAQNKKQGNTNGRNILFLLCCNHYWKK